MKDLMEEPTERNLPAPTPYLAGSNYNGKIVEAVLDSSDVNSFNAAQARVALMSEHTNFQDDVPHAHFPAAGSGIILFPTLK